MSGRIFQNIVLQFKETTDTVIGVIDSEVTVIACTDLTEIGQRWPHLVQPINEAEGACTALEGKTFKALEGWGGQFDFAAFTRGEDALSFFFFFMVFFFFFRCRAGSGHRRARARHCCYAEV